jgi:two-component system nitrogen regulation sensor histidine kinase NtrY
MNTDQLVRACQKVIKVASVAGVALRQWCSHKLGLYRMRLTEGAGSQKATSIDGLPFAEADSPAFRIGLVVVTLAVISGLATYLILTGLTPIAPRSSVVLTVLFINVAMIIAMMVVISWPISGLWRAWRARVPGARLHVRIVALFSVIAAIPAILLAVAATTTFSRSLDGWFSVRTRQIIENSLDIANAYLVEHGQVIRTDIVNMAKDLDDASGDVAGDIGKFRARVFFQAGLRDLPVAYVINGAGKPLVTAIENKNIPYRPPPKNVIDLAASGQVPLLMPRDAYRVAAVIKLANYPDSYLFVARGVSPKVMRHLRQTQAGVAEYQQLRRRRGGLHAAHALMYFMISLTSLLAAIWVGLWFASRFVAPIRRLISAAQEVSTGNLNVNLPERRGEGDLRRLSQTFNTMTHELKSQRDALVSANEQLTDRRIFMEAVLSGVSAGVLGLDESRRVTLANRSAEQLLQLETDALMGARLCDVVPELAAAVEELEKSGSRSRSQHNVTLLVNEQERTFAVRLTQEEGESPGGAVVTFDDITELVSAQRTSAWADVARRIAHEIKNPLTPIQLSAERIRRKYGKVIQEDREVFDKCTETIIRQVGDVSRMVDEFSSFARMPKAQMEVQDLRPALKNAVVLFQMSSTGTKFSMDFPDEEVIASFDRRLISQAMTNLVKNGAESVQGYAESGEAGADYQGKVVVKLGVADGVAIIEVRDNGTGLSKQHRARLLEPYVTTKAKGTGLGLAIVQKVIEQHGGSLQLEDAADTDGEAHGAVVRVRLPLHRREDEALEATELAGNL